MENLIIREADSSDAKDLLKFLKIVGGESDNLSFGEEGVPFSNEEEAIYLDAVKKSLKSVCYLALIDGEIVGSASLNTFKNRMSHRAEIGISVLKKYWNKGIGTKLTEKVIKFAKRKEIEIINLEVRKDNLAAINLYKKFGFKEAGISPSYLKVRGENIDFILMYLSLVK